MFFAQQKYKYNNLVGAVHQLPPAEIEFIRKIISAVEVPPERKGSREEYDR